MLDLEWFVEEKTVVRLGGDFRFPGSGDRGVREP